MEIEVNNSYSKLKNFTADSNFDLVESLIKEVLTYKIPIEHEINSLIFKIKFFRKIGKHDKANEAKARIQYLKENEVVTWYNPKTKEFPTGLLNLVKSCCSKIQYTIVDKRIRPTNDHIFKFKTRLPELHYYQKEMIDLGLKHGRGVFVSAVGSGKSFVLYSLIKELMVTTLVVAPSSALKDQLEQDLIKLFGKSNVSSIKTEDIKANKKLNPIRIATIQTLASLNKNNLIKHALKGVKALLSDEIHHSGAQSYTDLLPHLGEVYYRYGFTGTFIRNDSRTLDMWAFLSNVLYTYTAKQALLEQKLTPSVLITHTIEGTKKKNYQKEYSENYCGNPDLLKKIYNICEESKGKQVLILVKNTDSSGLLIQEYLTAHGLKATYICGDNKKQEISGAISDFNDKKISILIGSAVIGEGINIKSTDVLVMAQGGVSEVNIVQAIGRLVRLNEGKELGYIHDFRFQGTNYLEKHFLIRKQIYIDNFNCRIEKI